MPLRFVQLWLAPAFALLAFSLVAVQAVGTDPLVGIGHQTLAILIGGGLALWLAAQPIQRIRTASLPVYLVTLLMLLAAAWFGAPRDGVSDWLAVDLGALGAWSVRPAEWAMLSVPMVAAVLIAGQARETWRAAPLMIALVCLPAVLVARQPDLPSAAVMVTAAMLLWLSAGWWRSTLLVVIGLVTLLAIFLVAPQRTAHIATFADPEVHASDRAHQALLARTAVGGGGLTGQGWGEGLVTHCEETPGSALLTHQQDRWTFALLAEQFGLLGVAGLMLAYLALLGGLAWGLRRASPYPRALGVGLASVMLMQMAFHVGTSTGLTPVGEVTLPLISVGLNTLWPDLFALGLMLAAIRAPGRAPALPVAGSPGTLAWTGVAVALCGALGMRVLYLQDSFPGWSPIVTPELLRLCSG